jgi:hypothetical protein
MDSDSAEVRALDLEIEQLCDEEKRRRLNFEVKLNWLQEQRQGLAEKARLLSLWRNSRYSSGEGMDIDIAGGIDYHSADFKEPRPLTKDLKKYFGFSSFRSFQEPLCIRFSSVFIALIPVCFSIINAAHDGRNIIAILPTGTPSSNISPQEILMFRHSCRKISNLPAPCGPTQGTYTRRIATGLTYQRPSV